MAASIGSGAAAWVREQREAREAQEESKREE